MIANRPVSILIIALCATTACAPVGRSIQRVGTQIHEETVAMDHRVRDWFDTENQSIMAPERPAPITAYCYRTLSDVNCYAQPVRGAEERLVGKQTPEPAFADYTPIPEGKPDAPELVVKADKVTTIVAHPTPVTVNDLPPADKPQATASAEKKRQPHTLIPVFDSGKN